MSEFLVIAWYYEKGDILFALEYLYGTLER
jgi:hypothetical protein